jgi:hypothetical protein
MIPQVRPLCSSGECTWPPYGSLAICGDVANLTALGDKELLGTLDNATGKRLEVLANTSYATSQTLGYGDYYFQSIPKVFPIIIGLLPKPSRAFNQSIIDLMVSDTFIAYTDEMMNNTIPPRFDMSKMKYLEIALWWCTKTYSTKVTGGQPETEELATHSKLSSSVGTLNMPWSADFYPCYTAGTCNETYGGRMARLEAPPATAAVSPEDSYTIHVWTELTASGLVAATMFDSILLDHARGIVASNGGGVARAFGSTLLGDFQSTESPQPSKQLSNMRALVGNLARSMTNT